MAQMPAGPLVDEIFTDPVGPAQIARAEVHLSCDDPAVQIALPAHGRREKRRVEHLESNARGGDGHTRGFPYLTGWARSRQQPERLAQVLLDVAEIHASSVSRDAG